MSISKHIKEHLALGFSGTAFSAADARAAMDNGIVDGATNTGRIRWSPQGGQGRGPLNINVSEADFTVSIPKTAAVLNGTTTISNLSPAINIAPGMTVTDSSGNTRIPSGTTVVSVDTVANTCVISQAATYTGAENLTFAGNVQDPVITLGYNMAVGGTELVSNDGYGVFQLEGHFVQDSGNVALMEAFVAFGMNGARGQSRPIFCWYNKNTKKPLSVELSPGIGQRLQSYNEDYTGQAGNTYCYSVLHNVMELQHNRLTPDQHTSITLKSRASMVTKGVLTSGSAIVTGIPTTTNMTAGRAITGTNIPGGTTISAVLSESSIQMSANATGGDGVTEQDITYTTNSKGSSIAFTAEGSEAGNIGAMTLFCQGVGTSNANRRLDLYAPTVTGQVNFWNQKPNNSDRNSIQMSIGEALNSALVSLSSEYMPDTGWPTLFLKSKAINNTGDLIDCTGTTSAGARETNKWALAAKGFIKVKPSGGAVQSPTVGVGAVTPVFTDKPGTSAATAAVTWFPMLDTNGALFWVPGFAN